MLVPILREQLTIAMKAKDEPRKSVLRLVIAEIERMPSCGTEDAQKASELRCIRKLIEGNKETIAVMPKEDARLAPLVWENEFLSELLPKTLNIDEIKVELIAVQDKIVQAKSEGQATGEAMKHLKSKKLEVLGNDVQSVVRELRGN